MKYARKQSVTENWNLCYFRVFQLSSFPNGHMCIQEWVRLGEKEHRTIAEQGHRTEQSINSRGRGIYSEDGCRRMYFFLSFDGWVKYITVCFNWRGGLTDWFVSLTNFFSQRCCDRFCWTSVAVLFSGGKWIIFGKIQNRRFCVQSIRVCVCSCWLHS